MGEKEKIIKNNKQKLIKSRLEGDEIKSFLEGTQYKHMEFN